MVVIGYIGSEDFHLADEKLLLLGCKLIPWFEVLLRPGCELRIRRDHTKTFLVFKDAFAHFFISIIEKVHVMDFIYPFLCRVMRRMCCTRHIITEEFFVWIDLVDII